MQMWRISELLNCQIFKLCVQPKSPVVAYVAAVQSTPVWYLKVSNTSKSTQYLDCREWRNSQNYNRSYSVVLQKYGGWQQHLCRAAKKWTSQSPSQQGSWARFSQKLCDYLISELHIFCRKCWLLVIRSGILSFPTILNPQLQSMHWDGGVVCF